MSIQVVEFFAGVGGWRAALGEGVTIRMAYDISPHALDTYAVNHGHRPRARELASLPRAELAALGADTWVMSPPCQPFCRMGHHRDLADPRSRAFLHLVDLLREAPPRRLLLESVEGFWGSEAHALLTARLEGAGLHHRAYTLCPTRFGIPNQRPRAFLAASLDPLPDALPPAIPPGPLAPYLDAEEDPSLYLPAEVLDRHGPGLDLVRPWDTRSACFIGGYYRRFVGGGSYLVTPRGVRRFSVPEVARLLGWTSPLRFPASVPLEARYKLLGNGLSLTVARWVAQQVLPAAGG
ncbi:DNA cytosine methyltransferase [Mesoterricola sediminis]|uniref:DNA (cytosine-5-)-methyltransferase n=1 Tax=Mesoterricola sediminis TaxID=2927980 RepID=A0AA48HF95_9BACT|nr:DNA cytosine methyltransferase [Mesoterricola sediminis]BDU77163.1 DNA methyltransferase [Mesoterricola sediminis]